MTAWRRVAIEQVPELRKVVDEAWSPMAPWIELRLRFEAAFDQGDATLMERIMKYARWSWESPNPDAVTAVACAFFEHMPQHVGIRKQIPALFSRDEFERLKEVFSHHCGLAEIGEIEAAFKGRRTPAPG